MAVRETEETGAGRAASAAAIREAVDEPRASEEEDASEPRSAPASEARGAASEPGNGTTRRQARPPRTSGQTAGARATRARPARARPLRLTPRDRELLTWIARQRFCEVDQLAAREWPMGAWGGIRASDERRGRWSAKALASRLQLLKRAGLVASKRWWYERPAAWTVTRAGLREAGLPLAASEIDVRSYEHDREATDLCLALEDAFPHNQVLTEREIRSHDAGAEQPSYSLAEEGQGFARRRHYPDFAVVGWDTERGHLLVELERTVKGRARLERIIDLYAKSELRADFATVLYVVSDDDTERAVSAAIAAVRERAFDSPPPVCVVRWRPGEPLDPAPAYEFIERRWERRR